MTIREALLEATQQLELQHISDAPCCAEVLLIHFLKVDRAYLYTHDDRLLSDNEQTILESALNERLKGVPLQYIVGHQEFYGRDFIVNPSVLIPRPETEYIVESVLESKPDAGSRIIDVGTGSGCIAVTLGLELPRATVFASDISEKALKVAKLNSRNLNASVHFVCMDALDALCPDPRNPLLERGGVDARPEAEADGVVSINEPLALNTSSMDTTPALRATPPRSRRGLLTGTFDFVVSNPPYVPLSDFEHLQREVRDHEPHLALFSPNDALVVYRRLVRSSLDLLKPGGRLIMEIGFGMEQSVVGLLSEGWTRHETKTDLQGIPRTIVATRR